MVNDYSFTDNAMYLVAVSGTVLVVALILWFLQVWLRQKRKDGNGF